MIKSFVHGRLTGDPQLSENPTRCSFTVAANTAHRDPNTRQYTSEFVRTTVWGKRAEVVATHFHKGDGIVVIGDLYSDSFIDRDGNKRYQLHLENADFDFAERKAAPTDDEDDDILPD